jgi:hypothetical protein
VCLGTLAAEVPAILVGGGDWMPNHRLLSVYAPLLALALGVTADRLLDSARLPRVALVALVALLAAWCAFWPRGLWWDPSPDAQVASAEPCWGSIAEAAKPALKPSEDVVALEVLGVFAYKNPDVYVLDVFGLTDRRIARQGTYYVPTFGKMDLGYTYSLRPELVLTQIGPDFFGMMESTSSGAYGRNYDTYTLAPPGATERCAGKEFTAGIRKDVAGRILPSFTPFSPKPVESP